MAIVVYIERIHRLDQLISMRATGTPQQLANKLAISRRMLYEYIHTLKDMGGAIAYDKTSQSYYYTNGERLEMRFRKIR